MKSKPLIFTITTTLILLLVAWGIWLGINKDNIQESINERIIIPPVSKFIPRDADFSMHLNTKNHNISNYIDNLSPPKNQKKLREIIKSIRSEIFLPIGLEYNSDLSAWIGKDLSFTVFNENSNESDVGWLILIQSDSEDEKNVLLKDFWKNKIDSGEEIDIENFNGINISSLKNKDASIIDYSLASAYIEDTLLIGSSKNILKKSIDIYTKPESQEFTDNKFNKLTNNLNKGIILLKISEKGLINWFDLDRSILENTNLDGFIGSLSLDKNKILLNGIFPYKGEVSKDIFLEEKDFGIFKRDYFDEKKIFLTTSDIEIINSSKKEPKMQLLSPLIVESLENIKSESLKTIASLNNRMMFSIEEPSGWVIGTPKASPSPDKITEVLLKDNYKKSSINFKDQSLDVWSKLARSQNEIYTQLAAILLKREEVNWWSENLRALNELVDSNAIEIFEKDLMETNEAIDGTSTQQMFFDSTSTKKLLREWNPWQIIEIITSTSMVNSFNIDSMKLLIENDLEQDLSLVKLRAQVIMG